MRGFLRGSHEAPRVHEVFISSLSSLAVSSQPLRLLLPSTKLYFYYDLDALHILLVLIKRSLIEMNRTINNLTIHYFNCLILYTIRKSIEPPTAAYQSVRYSSAVMQLDCLVVYFIPAAVTQNITLIVAYFLCS